VTIFAGNLARTVTEDELRKLFQAFGEVSFVNITKERDQRTSAGFGFISMPVALEAEAAITGLHMKVVKGQAIKVNEVRPKTLVSA
jgi:RNA recognition motif-containing protein